MIILTQSDSIIPRGNDIFYHPNISSGSRGEGEWSLNTPHSHITGLPDIIGDNTFYPDEGGKGECGKDEMG